jgi:PAS domain S-box-containing protein
MTKQPTNKRIIHRGNSTISVEKLPDYTHPVVIKKPSKHHPSRQVLRFLENEYKMTRALNTVDGVRKALVQKSIDNQPALILGYIEGQTLRDTITGEPLNLRSRLKIAVDLTRILGNIHQQDVIHLDLNSKNILIANEHQAVRLIDLGSAAHIDRSGQQKVRPDQLLGTLPYISPEQTGRINRAVDERSDLYSLGVVLYELMTRQLPFDSKDPMQLIHHHLTRIPVSPSEVSSGIPKVISTIILKLLRKNAEDRYQSAAGAQVDLEKCLQRLKPDNTIEDFPLGEADYASRLIFPQKLYGRESGRKELENALESVCQDTSSIVFVGGNSGIGKTALVEEIQRPVSEKSGYFVEGKFDQLVTTPYAGITQGLALLVSQILTQTETQLATWRSRILEAVGPNGRVLTDLIPSLELVIGPQPAVPDLSAQEAQNRLYYVFQRFFGAIVHAEHPICFFLDDLQWVDPDSLGLLKALFTSPDLAHILVVGAYRDNEVRADHPLMMLIADLEKAGANLKRMTLAKLAEADIEALISDALRRDPDEIREFSRLVYSQTDGNPFFTRQALRSLEDQGLISLDTATGRWRWDMDTLRGRDFTTSVVELLVGKLKELPVDIQETLKVAACIGSQFDIATLKVVTQGDDDAILDYIHEAVAAGLIWERNDRGFFVHDRMQEAAYALVPPEDRDPAHLTIGRLLMQRYNAGDHEQDLYEIVGQLNHGLHLIEDEQERMQIARLNLQAARSVRRASAFDTGLAYAKAGIELLGENSWNQDYRLTLDLHEQAALLAYAAGDIPVMEQHSEQVLQCGRDPLDLAKVQRLQIEFLLSSKRFDEAIDLGFKALRILGQEFPPNPDMEVAIAKLSELLERLEREPPDYFSMPRLYDQDPELLAVSEILFPLGNAAFISRPTLAPLIYMRSLELSLERRLLPEHTPSIISAVGVFANVLLGKIEVANTYGETAVELASQPAFHTSICVPLHVHALHNHFWRKPLRETLDLFDRAVQSAHDSGNNEFAAYATHGWSKHAFYASIDLAQVEEHSLKRRTFLDGIQYVTQSRWLNIYVTAAQALRGSSSAQGITWRGTPFDDDRDLPDLQRVEDQLGLLYAYSAKAWVATLFGDHDVAEQYSDLSCSFQAVSPTGLENAIVSFVYGLRYARDLRENPDRPENEQAFEEQLGLLERFAGLAPMNFAHKLSLVQAEVHRARGEVLQAMQTYEQASQGAWENGYLNEAGLAYTLAAEFYRDLGLHQAALHNAEQAAQAWRSWGAHALVESLSHRFADLLGLSDLLWQSSSDAGKVHTTISQPITSIQLDMESIISASQMLSAETDLEQLLNKMITLVMANSGAETAVLLLKQNNDWFVQARGDSRSDKYDILLNQPYDPANSDDEGVIVPERVFDYCRRSKEVLVVGDAQLDHRFSEDRMIQKHNIKSMACIPALYRGELKGMLYFENRQMPDVFTLERVEILKHLSSQFGVSVENALFYDNLAHAEVKYRTVADFTYDWEYWANMDGTLNYVSPSCERISGYSVKDFKDNPFLFKEIIIPQDRELWDRHYHDSRQELKPREIQFRIQRRDGQIRWIEHFCQPVTDNQGLPHGFRASNRDITTRKQVEEGLRQSKEFNQSVLRSMPDHIAVLDREGHILTVNDAWIQFARENNANYPDRVGPGVNYLKICEEASDNGDETVTEALDGIRSVLDGSSEYFEMEYPCDSPTLKHWFLMTVSPFKGLKGGVIVAHIDITSRKMAEAQLRGAYTEIEQLKDQLESESAYLQDEIKLTHNFENIIGKSDSLKYVLRRVEQIAAADSPVLIMGETGTGKELIARAIHKLSPCGGRAMIKVNCAALPREMIESELFGHEKGAFTGATSSRQGRFEVANSSTLFLDEIGELPLELQAKLLRVLESGEYERLGSSKTLHSDARIIVATNRVLEEEVKKGRFREDLWYRLKVFPITVPPLRERLEDIPLLVRWIIDQLSRKMGKSVSEISKATMEKLQSYAWPGNVRELGHAIESALITSLGGKLNFDLPTIKGSKPKELKTFEEMERDYIIQVLKEKKWKIGGEDSAASVLGLNVSTLRGRMRKLGIKKPIPE